MQYKNSSSAISLLEVMVAMTIFFLGLISVYSVVSSTIRLNEYNKNFIIASNLAREQLEIVKNIRDYNFLKLRKWNTINSDSSIVWEVGNYYRVENNTSGYLDTRIEKIIDFGEGVGELSGKMLSYELCLTPEGVYTYICSGNNISTKFYRYLKVSRVEYRDNNSGDDVIIEPALKFESHVTWYKSGYHSTHITTILTDWQRL